MSWCSIIKFCKLEHYRPAKFSLNNAEICYTCAHDTVCLHLETKLPLNCTSSKEKNRIESMTQQNHQNTQHF